MRTPAAIVVSSTLVVATILAGTYGELLLVSSDGSGDLSGLDTRPVAVVRTDTIGRLSLDGTQVSLVDVDVREAAIDSAEARRQVLSGLGPYFARVQPQDVGLARIRFPGDLVLPPPSSRTPHVAGTRLAWVFVYDAVALPVLGDDSSAGRATHLAFTGAPTRRYAIVDAMTGDFLTTGLV